MKNDLVRFIALFDIHCGYEFNEESDYDPTLERFVKSHDTTLLGKVEKFCRSYKPDYVIYGGDQINLSCISRWSAGKPRMIEGRTIKEDFDFFVNLALPIGGALATRVWIEGNHEERLRELVNKNPQLEGLADCRTILENSVGVGAIDHFIYSGQLYKPDNCKLSFTHGHIVLGSGGNINHGKKLVDSYHRSVRAGHLHRHCAWTENVACDSADYHTGYVVAPMCRPNLPYAKNKPSSNQQGFLIGEYDYLSGNFWDTPVTVVNGEFVVNSKRY